MVKMVNVVRVVGVAKVIWVIWVVRFVRWMYILYRVPGVKHSRETFGGSSGVKGKALRVRGGQGGGIESVCQFSIF